MRTTIREFGVRASVHDSNRLFNWFSKKEKFIDWTELSICFFFLGIPDSGKASMNIIISSPDKPEKMHILGKDFAI
jgi:hypothetical protein